MLVISPRKEPQQLVPWLVWFSWLGIILQSERSRVQFLVRAHAWVAGLVLSWRQVINVSLSHQCFSPSLSPSLPLSLESIKEKRILKKRTTTTCFEELGNLYFSQSFD